MGDDDEFSDAANCGVGMVICWQKGKGEGVWQTYMVE